jgi:hypothetical protein
MSDKPSTDEEKAGEHLEVASSSSGNFTTLTPEEQKKVIRRVDIRLVITLGVLYCVSLLDRGNLSVAQIAGLADIPLASQSALGRCG